MELMSEYEHTECGTVTTVSDDFCEKGVYDPFYFSPGTTYCCGCEDFVPDDECVLANGRTMREFSEKLRADVPNSFRMVRSLLIPGVTGLVAAAVGWFASFQLPVALVGLLVGGAVGYVLIARWIMTPLRRAGKLWT